MSSIGGNVQRGWRRIAVVVAAAVFTSGCAASDSDADGAIESIDAPTSDAEVAGGADEADDPSADDAPESAADAAPSVDPAASPEVDVSVIPDEITLEYVDAVLVELERLYAEAAVIAATDGELTVEAADRISSVFGGERADDAYAVFQAIADAGDELLVSSDRRSPRSYEARTVLDESAGCLWIETLGDQSGLYEDAPAPQPTFVLLRRMTAIPSRNFNPTPWVYHAQRVGAETELQEAQPCSA